MRIPAVETLDEVIAGLLCARESALGPGELHFLRCQVPWSEEQLADKLQVDTDAVKAWERGDAKMERGDELLLRMACQGALESAETVISIENLERFARGESRDRPIRLRHDEEHGWRESQASPSKEGREKRSTLRY